jgi:hypothetical protein
LDDSGPYEERLEKLIQDAEKELNGANATVATKERNKPDKEDFADYY